MKTLTLEHLFAYLPYGLMGQLKGYPNGTYVTLGTYLSNTERKWTIDMFIESGVLPILYPLSSLTETIWYEGKEINPIDWLEDTYYTLSLHKECERLLEEGDYVWINHMSYLLIIHLCKWKIDIFGLIEKGLAVDVNTLETNPYK